MVSLGFRHAANRTITKRQLSAWVNRLVERATLSIVSRPETLYPWPLAFDARPETHEERTARCILAGI